MKNGSFFLIDIIIWNRGKNVWNLNKLFKFRSTLFWFLQMLPTKKVILSNPDLLIYPKILTNNALVTTTKWQKMHPHSVRRACFLLPHFSITVHYPVAVMSKAQPAKPVMSSEDNVPANLSWLVRNVRVVKLATMDFQTANVSESIIAPFCRLRTPS